MPKQLTPAAAEGVPTITRRSILSGLAVSTAFLAVPVTEASDKADAELLGLEAEFSASYDRFDAATERRSEIEARVLAAEPPKPIEPPMPKELDDALLGLTIEEIRDGRHPVCQATARHREEYRHSVDAWRTACEAIARDHGLPAAEAEQNRTMFEAADAADTVLDTPAQSLVGIMVKLRVHECWTFEPEDLLASIAADIGKMAEVQS